MLKHAEGSCEHLTQLRRLNSRSLVVEIASNDGYLLQFFRQLGIPVLGIEPAKNIAAIANQREIHTRAEFFTLELGKKLSREGVRADVVLGNNVLAHVADLNGFLQGVATILSEDGIAQFEVPYVVDLVDMVEFDTIYHEHVCYFSAHAVNRLLRRHSLVFADVQRIPVHGGSIRVTAAFKPDKNGGHRVEELLTYERARGVDRISFYEGLSFKVESLAARLRQLLNDLSLSGKQIAGYGASAKGAVLLNYLALNRGTIGYVVDRSPLKQGLFTPGTHLPIFPTDRLARDTPDYVLLLAWNIANEIMEQQSAFRNAGGRFIIPLPEPAVVS
jgi:hypothetical protein